MQEAKAASALNHPGIVTIHDIAQHDGVDFIAMEFVPGRTLERVIPPRGLGLNDAVDYAIQIGDALAAAHAAGIVLPDLKPSNVVVTEQGRIKNPGFRAGEPVDPPGRAMWEEGPTDTHPALVTAQGAIMGTVAYMSPEQAEGKVVDGRTDIFSFGSVLYEMVTGQRAFQGDTPLAAVTAVLREEPTQISQLREGVPRELERVVTRCLRKDPARRFSPATGTSPSPRKDSTSKPGCPGIRWVTLRISLPSLVSRRRSTFSALRLERSVASSLWIDMPGTASPCPPTSGPCYSHRWMPSPRI